MGTGNKMLGVTGLLWTGIPSRGSSNTPSRLHAMETKISSGSVGQFGQSAALPLYLREQYPGSLASVTAVK